MTHSSKIDQLREEKVVSLAFDQEIATPPKYYTFKRGGWYLLYDPVNVVWVRVNEDGLAIVNELRKSKTIEKVAVELSRDSVEMRTNMNELKSRLSDFLSDLVLVGFLHVGEYRKFHFPFFCQEVPTDVYLLMEYRCNLKCKYCYNESDRDQYNARGLDLLSLDEYAKLTDEMALMGITKVILTGGEPLLNPLTVDVAAYAHAKGIATELITNGQLVHNVKMEQLSEVFDIVTVSLDSNNQSIHEKWRGKGTFDRAVQAIREMKSAGITVRVNSVICKHNVGTMRETWAFAVNDLGVDVYTPALYTPNSGTDEELAEMLPGLSDLIMEQKKARAMLKGRIGVAVKAAKFRFSCGIANGEVSIGPDGTVFPCHTLHKPELMCGNVRDKGLQYVLKHSPIIEKLRKISVADMEKCGECDFKYLCGGGCLAMNYNMFGQFGREKNVYCNYLKLEQLERMWTSTELDSNAARHSSQISEGGA